MKVLNSVLKIRGCDAFSHLSEFVYLHQTNKTQ